MNLPQLPPATVESEQLSADPVPHVRFQKDLISEVSSSSISEGWGVCEQFKEGGGGMSCCLMYWAKCLFSQLFA